MPTTSQVEPQKLGTEEQQVLAKVELARMRKRDRLLKRARTYQGKRWLTIACLILLVWIAAKNVPFPYHILAAVFVALVLAVLQLHVSGVNQRIDALLEMKRDDDNNGRHGSDTAGPTDLKWRVLRQDDNGNRFEIAGGLPRRAAEQMLKDFEESGHKQVYWVEPDY